MGILIALPLQGPLLHMTGPSDGGQELGWPGDGSPGASLVPGVRLLTRARRNRALLLKSQGQGSSVASQAGLEC